jgi:5-oxoprolinase (ATP-hydrolysing) subunit C
MIELIQPGLSTLQVSLPRFGLRDRGIGIGGPADRLSSWIANRLLGLPSESPVYECTLQGPILRATCDGIACLVGADFASTLEGKPISMATIFPIREGEELRIGSTKQNLRGYFAFRPWDLSDTRPIGRGIGSYNPRRWLALNDPETIRFIPGPQFENYQQDPLLNQIYRVRSTSNRMGIRLEGSGFPAAKEEMISEPVCPGTIQITNEGLPILLGVDCQTIGGYPKLGYIIDADLDRLAQLRPNQTVRLEAVSVDEAIRINQEVEAIFGAASIRVGICIEW